MKTYIFLKKSSVEVKKHLAPPMEVFFMGAHTLESTIFTTLVALLPPSFKNGCLAYLLSIQALHVRSHELVTTYMPSTKL